MGFTANTIPISRSGWCGSRAIFMPKLAKPPEVRTHIYFDNPLAFAKENGIMNI
jgi:hypothetical protein